MKKILFFFSILFSLSFVSCKGQLDSKIDNISVKEMQSLLKNGDVQLVDVRTPKEFNSGFIANAENIDYASPSFDQDVNVLDKEKPVILYCHSGRRSAISTQKLLDAGFSKVYNLEGGILAWKKEGLEVVNP